jgi:hypothetical protein
MDAEHAAVTASVKEREPKPPGPLGTILTDGWRKKALEQGTPLINFVVAYPTGGSAFYKVGW